LADDSKKKGFNFYWIYILVLGVLAISFFFSESYKPKEIKTTRFEKLVEEGYVKKLVIVNKDYVDVYLTDEALKLQEFKAINKKAFTTTPEASFVYNIGNEQVFYEKLNKIPNGNKIPVDYEKDSEMVNTLVNYLIFFGIMIAIWLLVFRRLGNNGGPGGQLFNIGKSKATLFEKDTKVNVTFKDVAGLEEAKVEIMEIVDFLKNPKKYTDLGGKIPKGALLVGPPGTGKTLLAKAVAGEANVPFFSLSGSDFVEMFVGVGASRVRDLFRQAKEKSPCIIFIDEIDAIGRARGRNLVQGANDERENTLNQLLTEMDGFSTNSGVIILAATNRPDILDSALMRPGRFDRQISIDRPDMVGREAIFKVHLGPIKLGPGVDAKKLASQTPGFAGAEIANICNEAALIAARKNKQHVDMDDFQDAIDRVIGGLEKKNKIISPEERKIVAYHEAGHAIVGWFTENSHPLIKVSIVPRGVAALGYAQYLPKEQYLYTKEFYMDEVCVYLGGRAAEDIIFNKVSTGALSDLEQITKMVYNMVVIYGMNEKVGNVSFYDPNGQYGYGKPYSEKTAELIDNEIRLFIDESFVRTKELLRSKLELLHELAGVLLEKEIIFREDIERILGPRPFIDKNPELYATPSTEIPEGIEPPLVDPA
jgi:cell division protease FtsH